MSKKKLPSIINEGDIVILVDGRIFRAVEANFVGDSMQVEFMDQNEYTLLDPYTMKIEKNLGANDSFLLAFLVGKSLHSRLNRLNKV